MELHVIVWIEKVIVAQKSEGKFFTLQVYFSFVQIPHFIPETLQFSIKCRDQ
jgi:hypothetical protein